MNNSEMICDFVGEYAFLSNSYPSSLYLDNIKYPNVDQACLASLCRYKWDKESIRTAPSSQEAFNLMKNFEKNEESDSPEFRRAIMNDCLLRKFLCCKGMSEQLINTGNKKIFDGTPDNVVGTIIMDIRKNIIAGNYIYGIRVHEITQDIEQWTITGYYRKRKDAEMILKAHKDWYSQSPCPLDNDHLFIILIK